MADIMGRKVVITGLGLATPLGLDAEESWEKALNGTSGIKRLDPRLGKCPIGVAGQVSSEDWDRICRAFPEEAESEGERRTLFALWAAEKAQVTLVWKTNSGSGHDSGWLLPPGSVSTV